MTGVMEVVVMEEGSGICPGSKEQVEVVEERGEGEMG